MQSLLFQRGQREIETLTNFGNDFNGSFQITGMTNGRIFQPNSNEMTMLKGGGATECFLDAELFSELKDSMINVCP